MPKSKQKPTPLEVLFADNEKAGADGVLLLTGQAPLENALASGERLQLLCGGFSLTGQAKIGLF